MNHTISAKKSLIIIVDAYGPARHFCHYLKKQGILSIHLLGTPQPLPRLTLYDLESYDATLIHTGNFSQTVANIKQLLKKFNAILKEIIPGVEPGVLLADRLSYHFNLHYNNPQKSVARRNKATMADAVSACGITTPAYCKASRFEDVTVFAQKHNWPLVLKPLDSAGTNGVFFCYSQSDLFRAFHQVIGKENNMGHINKAVLLQTFMQGQEYIVNTVSYMGKHYISDIWQVNKKDVAGYARIYDQDILIAGNNKEYELLKDYVFKVLDALDIRFGPAHTELILTNEGPVLIEVGARISGAVDPEFNQAALGYDQIELTLESYLNPEIFKLRIDQNEPYKIKKQALMICLAAKADGIITTDTFAEQLVKVASVINFNLKFTLGDKVNKTFDISSSLGLVRLVADTHDLLKEDYLKIQSLLEQHVQIC